MIAKLVFENGWPTEQNDAWIQAEIGSKKTSIKLSSQEPRELDGLLVITGELVERKGTVWQYLFAPSLDQARATKHFIDPPANAEEMLSEITGQASPKAPVTTAFAEPWRQEIGSLCG